MMKSRTKTGAEILDRSKALPLTPGLVAAIVLRNNAWAVEPEVDPEVLRWSGPLAQWLPQVIMLACSNYLWIVVHGRKPCGLDRGFVEEVMGRGGYAPEREAEFVRAFDHIEGVTEQLLDQTRTWARRAELENALANA